MKFSFKRVCLIALIVFMPFLFSLADKAWNLSRSNVLRHASYDEKCLIILAICGIAVVLAFRILAGKEKEGDEPPIIIVNGGFPPEQNPQPPIYGPGQRMFPPRRQ